MEAASRGAASVGGSVVAVGGEAGTLSEIGLAMKLGRSVLGLDLGEGWSARLPGLERARDVPGVLAWLESRGAPASSS